MPIVPSPSLGAPPSTERGGISAGRAATGMEAERNRLVSQVGFWAASFTAVCALGWVVAVTLATASFPAGAWGGVTQFVPSLFLALAYVALMVAIQHRTPVERRISPSIALQLATIYAALNATVYFVELTLVVPHQLGGNLGDLRPLVMQPGAFLYAVDVFGYGIMSLAAAVVASAFAASPSRLERWIYWLLLANWPIALFGPPIMMFWSQAVPLMLLWAAIWTLTIPVPAILLAVLFQREGRHASSRG